MDTHSMDSLSVIGFHRERNTNNGSQGRSKNKGGSISLGKSIRKCWECGKCKHYKKDFISKNVNK